MSLKEVLGKLRIEISVRQARSCLEQIRASLETSEEVEFEAEKREEICGWISGTVQGNDYGRQNRANRGLLPVYIVKLTGLSRAQVTRLFGRYLVSGEVKAVGYQRHRFAPRYARADAELETL